MSPAEGCNEGNDGLRMRLDSQSVDHRHVHAERLLLPHSTLGQMRAGMRCVMPDLTNQSTPQLAWTLTKHKDVYVLLGSEVSDGSPWVSLQHTIRQQTITEFSQVAKAQSRVPACHTYAWKGEGDSRLYGSPVGAQLSEVVV